MTVYFQAEVNTKMCEYLSFEKKCIESNVIHIEVEVQHYMQNRQPKLSKRSNSFKWMEL